MRQPKPDDHINKNLGPQLFYYRTKNVKKMNQYLSSKYLVHRWAKCDKRLINGLHVTMG